MINISIKINKKSQGMIVEEQLRKRERDKVYASKDKNLVFLQMISTYYREQKILKQISLNERSQKIVEKLINLSIEQRKEWSQILIITARELLMKVRYLNHALVLDQTCETKLSVVGKLFRQKIITIVTLCVDLRIAYDSKRVENMIMEFYFVEYREEALTYFCAVDYEASKYSLFEKRKKASFYCCKSERGEEVEISSDTEQLERPLQ